MNPELEPPHDGAEPPLDDLASWLPAADEVVERVESQDVTWQVRQVPEGQRGTVVEADADRAALVEVYLKATVRVPLHLLRPWRAVQ